MHMHLLDALQQILTWSIDHADKLHHLAKIFFLVRSELTKKPAKDEKAAPNKDTAFSRKKAKLKK